MKKNNLLFSAVSVLTMLWQLSQPAYCQKKIIKSPSETAVIKKLIIAVQTTPDNIQVHENFINSLNINDPILVNQYMLWMNRFRKSAIVPFELGKTLEEYKNPVCEKYLREALTRDSTLADAWKYLSRNATLKGDKSAALEYMQKAAFYDPKNAETAFSYAYLNRDGDQAKYDSLMLNVVYHFPESEKGAEALNRLADITFNANEKTAYYETLYQMYSHTQFAWFRYGMADYYTYLLNTSPGKAFELALKMVVKVKINRGDWKLRLTVARDFIEARKLLDANKPMDAAAVLEKVNLGNSKIGGITIDADETLALIKAEAADKAGYTKAAFDSVGVFYSKKPTVRLRNILLSYGSKLGLDSNKVDSGVWRIRNNAAWAHTDFTLEKFADHQLLSLSAYKGKVILLTFWDPGCFPCREEFPHFESVLNKFKRDSVIYLAINVDNAQEEYVRPFIKTNNYSFIPLRDDPNKEKGNLPKLTSIPASFLIDQQGRVIFSDFQINGKNENALELMISELLKFGNSSNRIDKNTVAQQVDNGVLASKNK